MSYAKILIVEDEKEISSLVKDYLTASNYDVIVADDGEQGVALFRKEQPDMAILDIMLPKMDGFEVCRTIRQESKIPIIMLSARKEDTDKILGLGLGADDYITKPFNIEELIARIETIRRRVYNNNTNIEKKTFTLGSLTFDSNKQVLISEDGHEDKLTTKECELLYLLCINANKVLEREIALKTIWNDDHFLNVRTMDVYITKLRKHLKKENSIEIINVHGKGYKLIV